VQGVEQRLGPTAPDQVEVGVQDPPSFVGRSTSRIPSQPNTTKSFPFQKEKKNQDLIDLI
jgi:hypothetical protein